MRRVSAGRFLSHLALALGFTLLTSGAAFAADTSLAEKLFADGLAAMKREDYRAACDSFGGSNESDPSPGTQINLALCNEKQGKLASAWGWYRTAAGLADQRGQKDRAELARGEAAKLEGKLVSLLITAKVPAEGMTVTRNGTPVPAAALGRENPIDPGEYTIEATAKNKKPYKQKVVIHAAGAGTDRVTRFEIPALEDAPEGTPGVGGGDYRPPSGSEGSDGSTQRNIGLIVGGGGLVAGVVATILTFMTISEEKERKDAQAQAEAQPPGEARTNFSDSANSHRDAALANQTWAIVVGSAGGAMIIGGVVLILTAPSKRSANLDGPTVTPTFGLGGLGLRGTF